ncbi:MAG: TrkA family potassium uptake protein [Candidatus Omnitrophica bacterium]|nr:TrkA family potassium uptake protein [Candidatus Omnitrophota bacterium]
MRQFAVIGLGRFGASVAKTLAHHGAQVIGVDQDEEKIQQASEYLANAVCADATDMKALRAVGVDEVEVAVVSVGEDLESSIMTTIVLKELGIPEIIAKAVTGVHGRVLKKVGASRIVSPEKEMGIRVATSLISPEVVEYINLSKDHAIYELHPPPEFLGKSLKELDVRAKFGLNVIAIKKPGENDEDSELEVSPSAKAIVEKGSVLVVLGAQESIERLRQQYSTEKG